MGQSRPPLLPIGINSKILGDPTKPARFLPVLGNIDHFIIFGADVTHPAPGARNDPGERSIAAIVGSRDRAAVRSDMDIDLGAH